MSGVINAAGSKSGVLDSGLRADVPSFHVYASGGWQPWASGFRNIDTLTTVVHDTGNNWNSTTHFTAPVLGSYFFHGAIYLNTTTTSYIEIRVDNSIAAYSLKDYSQKGHHETTLIWKLNAGQRVTFGFSSATTSNTYYAGIGHTWFEGHLIG